MQRMHVLPEAQLCKEILQTAGVRWRPGTCGLNPIKISRVMVCEPRIALALPQAQADWTPPQKEDTSETFTRCTSMQILQRKCYLAKHTPCKCKAAQLTVPADGAGSGSFTSRMHASSAGDGAVTTKKSSSKALLGMSRAQSDLGR